MPLKEMMTEEDNKLMKNYKKLAIGITVVFGIVMMAFVVFMNAKNSNDLNAILVDSVEKQLIATAYAATEVIDVDRVDAYNSLEDVAADQERYDATLAELRALADRLDVAYIYVLKEIDGAYEFVFDTDPEDEEIFVPYEISDVHYEAFQGREGVDIMNVDDIYGSFNTSAVPLFKDGRVIAILSVDIEDTFIEGSLNAARNNIIVLVVVLLLTMGAMAFTIMRLLRNVQRMQRKLQHMAHYDTVTSLPNRQYLMSFLDDVTSKDDAADFALLFIDLDNFKQVNDNAGHDAGDEVLRDIATYLESAVKNAKAFRMSAGWINVAARVGGDEFIQLISGIHNEKEAGDVAQKILDGFAEKKLDRHIEKYNVGLSIGVALYPYHTNNYHVLIKYADLAMYNAKREGKNRYCIYSDEMSGE